MARQSLDSSTLFVEHIKKMVSNLLINNPNYNNNYYVSYASGGQGGDLLADTKDRAQYILDTIERQRHMVEEE